jgi:glucose-6-phosphate isomerase
MKFNYANAISEIIGGNGVSAEEIKNASEMLEKVKERINDKLKSDYFALQLAYLMSMKATEVVETAEEIKKNYENFVVVGMGGSSLGNQLLHFAFNGVYYNETNTPKIYFLDNIDPESTTALLKNINLEKTMFNIITKSGSTAETINNFLVITDMLKEKGLNLKDHLIFTTDPQKGLLRELSKTYNIKTFDIPEQVGGRYSVLSPVGLLSAAVEGIDVPVLLRGAELMRLKIINSDATNCSALILPFLQYKMFKEKGVNINGIFAYSDGLSYLGQWYRQLLSESIGKKFDRAGNVVNAGITPLSVRGTSDQHSILQLFLEGPFDKFLILVAPKEYRSDIKVSGDIVNNEYTSYLKGKNYSELIRSEFLATQAALKKNGRPFVTIQIPKIKEEEIGKLIYLFEYSVIALGEMLNVNPIDQPAVELGKKFTYGIMGRNGFEKEKEEFEKLMGEKEEFTITYDAL